MKSKYLLRIFLLIVLIVSTVSVISMMVAISATESDNQALEDQIQEQKLRNSEKSELLDEENDKVQVMAIIYNKRDQIKQLQNLDRLE